MTTKYSLVVEYSGFSPEFDDRIHKTIRRESDGSGAGMYGRDISFSYKTKLGVTNARKKLKNRFRSKIRCYIYEE